MPLRSMPSCLMTSRCTSATVTLSITWSRPRTRDAVDDLGAVAGEPRGEIVGLLRFGRARDRAGQHDAVGEAFDGDVGSRAARA